MRLREPAAQRHLPLLQDLLGCGLELVAYGLGLLARCPMAEQACLNLRLIAGEAEDNLAV